MEPSTAQAGGGRNSVFLLWHVGPDFAEFGDDEDSKLLGVFTTADAARQWQQDAVTQPGFRDAPDRFVLDEYVLDERHWREGFVSGEDAMPPEVAEQ